MCLNLKPGINLVVKQLNIKEIQNHREKIFMNI